MWWLFWKDCPLFDPGAVGEVGAWLEVSSSLLTLCSELEVRAGWQMEVHALSPGISVASRVILEERAVAFAIPGSLVVPRRVHHRKFLYLMLWSSTHTWIEEMKRELALRQVPVFWGLPGSLQVQMLKRFRDLLREVSLTSVTQLDNRTF